MEKRLRVEFAINSCGLWLSKLCQAAALQTRITSIRLTRTADELGSFARPDRSQNASPWRSTAASRVEYSAITDIAGLTQILILKLCTRRLTMAPLWLAADTLYIAH
jgi:hypothetical protein